LLLVAMVSIQSGASLAKSLFPMVGARGATALRLSLAALVMGAIWRPWRQPLTSRQRTDIVLYGVALGCMNLTFYLALARIPLGIAVALEFLGPLGVALFASRRLRDVAWALLAGLGIAAILVAGRSAEMTAPLDWMGVGYVLIAGACWALYIILGQRAGAAAPSGIVAALGIFTAACVAVPFSVFAPRPQPITIWAALPIAVAVALLSSVVPYTLEMVALKRLPARTFGILLSIEPAIAALLGWGYLGERLSMPQWLGIGCVMLASFGSAASIQRPVMTAEGTL
jgi:inner membrane transporter RhtA